jgi:tetratricopeptide (TPR) repeat protein
LENLSVNPKEENSFFGLVDLYLREKQKKQALSFAQKLFRYSQNPAILTSAGSLFASQGYEKIALSFYNKALAINPLNKDTYLELGKILDTTLGAKK